MLVFPDEELSINKSMTPAYVIFGFEPTICRIPFGVLVPIPTFPALVICNREDPDDEAMLKGSYAPDVPHISSLEAGEVVPMPTLPVLVILIHSVELVARIIGAEAE